jgi:hypothetical protein
MAKRKRKTPSLTTKDKNALRRILKKVRAMRGKKKPASVDLTKQFADLSAEYQRGVAVIRDSQSLASRGGLRTAQALADANAATIKFNNAANAIAVFVQMHPEFLNQLKILTSNVHF